MLKKIISGGQTGVDRAALNFAIAHRIPHGGWCPRGRRAEDGIINPRYHLIETPTASRLQRTKWNVRDSDATLIFSINPTLRGGSKQTARFAHQYRKPWLHLCRTNDAKSAPKRLAGFLVQHKVKTLNVAGPRKSEEPSAGRFARKVLSECPKCIPRP